MTLEKEIKVFMKDKGLSSENTMVNYESALNMLAEHSYGKSIYQLTKEEIEALDFNLLTDYKFHLLSSNSNGTVNSRLGAIRSFLKYMTARGIIEYKDISKLELIENLSDDSEVTEMIPKEVLYDYVDYFEINERKGKEKKWASLLLLETGNRAQDILSITKNQLVPDGDTYILKSKGKNKGKGNKDYFERIGKDMYEELMKLNPESDKVFSITYKALYSAFNRANDHFGNKVIRYTPHSIKHLALLLEWRYTGDILAVQRKGKHSSLETTRRYLKIDEVLVVGAYTRDSMTDLDLFENVEHEELLDVIRDLPLDVRMLLNQKLASK